MDARDRHQHATELFLRLRILPVPDRDAVLHDTCGADLELRAEVEGMLRMDQQPGTLDSTALGAGFRIMWQDGKEAKADHGTPARIVWTEGDPDLPAQIGDFRVIDVLGVGGMSIVYRAEQEQPRRIVALKLLGPWVLTPRGRHRLEHEAKLLGRLQHPGIARIYEVGVVEGPSGTQPFLAMELVHGRPLDRYCEEESLNRPERLSRFVEVCGAVHHAHERGIVHRDLKPENILVTENGHPKVVDFGVAFTLSADPPTAGIQTNAAEPIGTLAYMSPEQTTGGSRELDTRADVYALGVILYRLLSGRLPLSLERTSIPAALAAIREQSPLPLGSIDRSLRGDLETIAGKALEKDRNRRYASALELARDVERFLRHEPIGARPPSADWQA